MLYAKEWDSSQCVFGSWICKQSFIWHGARFKYQRALICPVPVVFVSVLFTMSHELVVYVTMLPSSGTSQTLYSNYSCYVISGQTVLNSVVCVNSMSKCLQSWQPSDGWAIKHRPECLITCHDSNFSVIKPHFLYAWIIWSNREKKERKMWTYTKGIVKFCNNIPACYNLP